MSDLRHSCIDRRDANALVQVVLQCEILGNQYGLAVFLDHVEVVSGVHSPLKQDPVQRVSGFCQRWFLVGIGH